MEVQLYFDHLVSASVAYYQARAFSPEEIALKQFLDVARERDADVVSAADAVAWSKVAPAGLEWR